LRDALSSDEKRDKGTLPVSQMPRGDLSKQFACWKDFLQTCRTVCFEGILLVPFFSNYNNQCNECAKRRGYDGRIDGRIYEMSER